MEFRLDGTLHDQTQVSGDLEMTVELSRGAEGNPETPDELNRRAECVSFHHVGGDRYGSPADLVGEPEM